MRPNLEKTITDRIASRVGCRPPYRVCRRCGRRHAPCLLLCVLRQCRRCCWHSKGSRACAAVAGWMAARLQLEILDLLAEMRPTDFVELVGACTCPPPREGAPPSPDGRPPLPAGLLPVAVSWPPPGTLVLACSRCQPCCRPACIRKGIAKARLRAAQPDAALSLPPCAPPAALPPSPSRSTTWRRHCRPQRCKCWSSTGGGTWRPRRRRGGALGTPCCRCGCCVGMSLSTMRGCVCVAVAFVRG